MNLPLPTKKAATLTGDTYAGSALSLHIAQQLSQQRGLLVLITHDPLTTQRFAHELSFFTDHQIPLLQFPDWETLPYDRFSPHQEIISQRLRILAQLPTLTHGILLAHASTWMQRLSPYEYIASQVFQLQINTRMDLEALKHRFAQAGYQHVAQVLAPGEFAVRGSLFDIFPMGAPHPYRIDFFDNEIESIRVFDPETQRSLESVEAIDLLPAREFPLTAEAIQRFRQQFREQFPGNPADCPAYATISQGSTIAGCEYYLPLFFEKTATLIDYLPENTVIIRINDIAEALEKFHEEIHTRYDQLRYDRTHPLLPPEKLFLTPTEVFTQLKNFPQIRVQNIPWPTPDIAIDHKADQPLAKLQQYLQQQKARILFCAESAGRREALLPLLQKAGLNPAIVHHWSEFMHGTFPLALTVAPLEQGLTLETPEILIIPENILLGYHVSQQRRRKTAERELENAIRNLAELQIGDAVVHTDYGVGRYQGLQTLQIGENSSEYLVLEYADNDKIYVPVVSLHLIHRYGGMDPENAPLTKLGTDQWEKAKRKAAEKIRDVAAELLVLHAKRELQHGVTYPFAEDSYQQFVNEFPFEETPDQQQAIAEVITDMCSERRMDRLVCGDVGFGKTEVAMRAAFIAVQAGYQVAVLVPTTLLAQQHYQNFCDRFAEWPVHIDLLSRFRSPQQQQVALEKLADGKIDIIIGTHKLLQSDVVFKNLGLIIIDEEHRFGVRQKEHMKKLRAEVDILNLTATPIPRTLNMAMSSLRDLSIIGTPPARRLAIKTFVHAWQEGLIREAILREIMRGGQVFYLHNTVETINKAAEILQILVPEARIRIAHGQMRERELEIVMREFYHQHFNVLVCTTIIETGIDIPSANTIIIERADKFGLAQLHQLRGRVGRSHHQAYAYLLTPDKKLTADAEKRLEALARLEELGAGFALATHDLEIRGAGEILGEEQSGHVQTIGFSLYMSLLERAIKTLKNGEKLDLLTPPATLEIDLQIPALIPDHYIPNVHTRLILYKRLANAENTAQLEELKVEFIDRFGLLPPAVQNLFSVTQLKLHAQPLGVKKITGNSKIITIEFDANPKIDTLKLIQRVQKQPQHYQFGQGNKLRLSQFPEEAPARLAYITNILQEICFST